jgi:hypothetical protein
MAARRWDDMAAIDEFFGRAGEIPINKCHENWHESHDAARLLARASVSDGSWALRDRSNSIMSDCPARGFPQSLVQSKQDGPRGSNTQQAKFSLLETVAISSFSPCAPARYISPGI